MFERFGAGDSEPSREFRWIGGVTPPDSLQRPPALPGLTRRRVGAPCARGWNGGASEVVELRLRVTREEAERLEAGVPCREIQIERLEGDRIALLLSASNREQWLMHVMARAEWAEVN